MRKVALVIGFVLLIPIALMGIFLYSNLRTSENGPVADVSWQASGKRMVVDVTVKDTSGRPVPGVEVQVENNSGTNGETTDAEGRASIRMGESDFMGLKLNRVRVVNRPFAFFLCSPHVADGLSIEVILKDPNAIRR